MYSNLTNIVLFMGSMLFGMIVSLLNNFVKLILIVTMKFIMKSTIIKTVSLDFSCRHSPPENQWLEDEHPRNTDNGT